MSTLRRRLMMANQGPQAPKPVFYTYLVFDGNSYIETGYVLPSTCSIAVPLGNESSKTGPQGVFSAGGGGGYIALILGGSTSASKGRQTLPYYDTSSYVISNRYLSFNYTTYSFFLTPKRYGWGNGSFTYTKGSLHPTDALYLGTNNGHTNHYTGTMQTFMVFGSGAQNATTYAAVTAYTPVATFRPCTYNGAAGMWYVEGNTFYGNSGSGTLTATNTI